MKNLSNTIKRINKRYVDIVKKWGEQSRIANNYRNLMQALPTRTTKSGYLSVRNLSQYDSVDENIIKRLANFQTQGQYTKKIKGDYNEYLKSWYDSGQQGPSVDYETGLKEFEKKSGEIHDKIMQYKDAIYSISPKTTNILHRSSNMTWSEVFEFEKIINEISSKNLQNNINLSNYLAIPDNQMRIQNEIKEYEDVDSW